MVSHLITSQLVEAHQQCHRKAFHFLCGSAEAHPHEYKTVVEERAVKRRMDSLAPFSSQEGRTTQTPNAPVFAIAQYWRTSCVDCTSCIDCTSSYRDALVADAARRKTYRLSFPFHRLAVAKCEIGL